MSTDFDPGYGGQPFKTLVENYPADDVYPAGDFRVEWGPIFHRGRLDGSARVLVLGQDPAAHESVVRRILVGEAGQRTQGFLAKLGITKSYVLVNTFLYSVYGQGGGERHKNDTKIAAYRNKWLDALLVNSQVEAVVALGTLAQAAWNQYKATPTGSALNVTFAKITHPTYPESSAGGNAAKLKAATKQMLATWNVGLATLFNALTQRDVNVPLVPYGDAFKDGEITDIPAIDFPAGLPAFMRSGMAWAARTGANAATKRRTLTITIPTKLMPAATPPAASPHALLGRAGASFELTAKATVPWPDAADADAEHFALIARDIVDPAPTPKFALKGRIVCMDAARTVIKQGVVYVSGGVIVAVQAATAPLPASFTTGDIIDTGGTIYPGLIELHNHLPYNVLRLWDVPKKYTDRNTWRGGQEYHNAVVAPMSVLAREKALAPYIARYTECKAIFGGVTTSQGITLIGSSVTSQYRGLVRNVEQTDEPSTLPAASTNIADVEGYNGGVEALAATLKKCETRGAAFLHHLSEGTDDRTRGHFLKLKRSGGQWALSRSMVGIHSVALNEADLDVMAAHDAAIVWSPLSNLLLYGDTAKIKKAKSAGIRIALGSDWSPSGSKNLLGELKAACAASDALGFDLTDQDLVEMATSGAASVARWERQVGSVEPGKKADLLVLDGAAGNANSVYGTLISASESDVKLVVINGIKRYGTPVLMKKVNGPTESVTIGGAKHILNLENPTGSQFPDVTYADAKRKLTEALNKLPQLAKAQEAAAAGGGVLHAMGGNAAPHPLARAFGGERALEQAAEHGFAIELDELVEPLIPVGPPGARAAMMAKALPNSQVVKPLKLDPPTAVDDPDFLPALAVEKNPPQKFKVALKKLYV